MVEKARLVEIQGYSTQKRKTQGGKTVEVHFNPETLKLSFANEHKGGDQPSGNSKQFVGSASSKMSVELLFDTTTQTKVSNQDVRRETQKVAYFIMAKEQKDKKKKRVPPRVRFEWGTFIFEGIVDSMDETLEYFSERGVPMRATVSLNLSRDDLVFVFGKPGKAGGDTPRPSAAEQGTTPLASPQKDESVQEMAARQGDSSEWKAIAAANDIDDPLRLPPGTLLDMSPGAGAGAGVGTAAGARTGGRVEVGFSAGLGGGVGFGAVASASAAAGIGGSAGIGTGASLDASAGFGAGAGIGSGADLAADARIGTGARFGADADLDTHAGAGFGAGVDVIG